ncbi:MAG: hypothetical protein CML61_10125 [Rhodobacteraceae bacterium]|nr:hypothetical protein [Paracoccaceae bacterium]
MVTILRKGASTGPSYEPTQSADIEYPVSALVGEYSVMERASSQIETTDIKLFIAAGQGVVPAAQDRVRIAGKVHFVKNVMPLQPGGEPLMYELQVHS